MLQTEELNLIIWLQTPFICIDYKKNAIFNEEI